MNSSVKAACALGLTVCPLGAAMRGPWHLWQKCQPAAPDQGSILNLRLLEMENAYTFPAPFYKIPFPSPYSSCPIPGTPVTRASSHDNFI